MSEGAKGRALTPREKAWIAKARGKAEILYEGRLTPHRSCGIALAETFNLPTPAYQVLRRGGITGDGRCGAIRAGEQVLGELLGDPDPTASVTEALRNAVTWFKEQVPERVDRRNSPDYICNNLTRQHGDFRGPERAAHCTSIAAQVAELTAEALIRFGPGLAIDIKPVKDLS
jgi:hypothetical protein